MNYIIWLSYDGTRYDGWQKQGNTEKTIQGKLERILEKLDGEPVEVRGSGRTDAGVHAQGQVADFRLKGKRTWDCKKAEIERSRRQKEQLMVRCLGIFCVCRLSWCGNTDLGEEGRTL